MAGNRKRYLAVIFMLSLCLVYNARSGVPHTAYGDLRYADGSTVSSATFTAYIIGRSGETLNQSSFGCGFSSGTWFVQTGNFATNWSAGNILHVDFSDGSGFSGSIEVTLTNDPGDDAGVTTLTQNPSPVKLLIPDDSAVRGYTVNIPVDVENLAPADSVIAYELVVSFDADVLLAIGAEEQGSMTQNWGSPFTGPRGEEMSVAAFTSNIPSARLVADGGHLVYLTFLVHGIPSSQTSNTTLIRILKATIHTLTETIVVSHTKTGALEVDVNPVTVQRDITLYPNWNLVSLSIVPDPTDIPDVFGSIDIDYVFGYWSGSGPRTWSSSRPSFLNDLLRLDAIHGYWVKSGESNPASWQIEGPSIAINTPIPLYSGWNLIGYLPLQADSIAHSLASIDTLYSNLMGYDASGPGTQTWSRSRLPILNDLNVLTPYRGYWIKLDSSKTLIYPTGGYQSPEARTENNALAEMPGKSGHQTLIPQSCDFWAYQPSILSFGDTVRVYDSDGVLCGDTLVSIEGGFLVHVTGDDPATPEDEGAAEGDTVIFMINDYLGIIVGTSNSNEVDIIPGMPPIFVNLGNKKIEFSPETRIGRNQKTTIPESFVLEQNYPNPFNGETRIDFTVDRTGIIDICIYDTMGRMVRNLARNIVNPGYHSLIWDGTDNEGAAVSSGNYTLLARFGAEKRTQKLILLN